MNQSEELLDPLDQFYLVSGLAVPEATKVDAESIPEPYRSLLVHENDMTPTLEAAYGQRIHIRLVSRKVEADVLLRQVVLVLDSDERPVEFGAIRIQLNQLPAAARARVLEGKLPLGRAVAGFPRPAPQPASCLLRGKGRLADRRGLGRLRVGSDSTGGGTSCSYLPVQCLQKSWRSCRLPNRVLCDGEKLIVDIKKNRQSNINKFT